MVLGCKRTGSAVSQRTCADRKPIGELAVGWSNTNREYGADVFSSPLQMEI